MYTHIYIYIYIYFLNAPIAYRLFIPAGEGEDGRLPRALCKYTYVYTYCMYMWPSAYSITFFAISPHLPGDKCLVRRALQLAV